MPDPFNWPLRAALVIVASVVGLGSTPEAAAADGHRKLVGLFEEWRAFERPKIRDCVPDYGAAAMAEKAKGLEEFQKKLAAIDARGWPPSRLGDKALVEAEMNGLDFDLRVLKPWARDPAFYASVFAEDSDVPEHEGPTFHPAIDLQTYEYPLSKKDQRELTCLLGAVPAILEQARVNLKESNARDLWIYGASAFQAQSATLAAFASGELDMRTLEGTVRADMTGADESLLDAISEARAATDSFRAWLEAEAPSKTGPSGVGKENYDWYMENVHLVPYGWDEQATLLRRELERARASLALEEFRNRDLRPLDPLDDPDAWRAMAQAKMRTLVDFLIDNDLVEDRKYFRAAMEAQIGQYTPPDARNFFAHGAARDPSPLYSHFYHWIELARRKHEPHSSPIRAATPLYDMYDSRSEGMATAVEELFMQAGLYDETPRAREIVWVMLANRAARGLASLYVQANEMTLQEAGKFHAEWTPWKWSDPSNELVAFEQLLYLRQPGYGTSYVTGKLALDRLLSEYAFEQERKRKAFDLPEFFRKLNESDVVPFPLIAADMAAFPLQVDGTAAPE